MREADKPAITFCRKPFQQQTGVKMAGKNVPKGRTAKRSRRTPRFDMDLYFKSGYQAKVAKNLGSNEATRKLFGLIEEQDRNSLVLLLCNVVYCRRLSVKTHNAFQAIGGSRSKVQYAAQRVSAFSKWLALQIQNNFDLASDNTIGDVIPKLQRIAETLSLAPDETRSIVRDRNLLYVEALDSLARFMEEKTGRPCYPAIKRLLEETARALGTRQTYDAHTILVRVQAHRSQ